MLYNLSPLTTRTYGVSGPTVFVLHSGPAAAGEAAPIAEGLAKSFRTIEPFQRGSGENPLTVRQHIADLYNLVKMEFSRQKPAIVGESWGAMLALAYAAEYYHTVSALVLVGCGTFDKELCTCAR